MSDYDRYLRHARRFGACPEFWQAAVGDLTHAQLERLARELAVKLPKKWATPENARSEPASQAGLTANKTGGPTNGSRAPVSSGERARACRDCGRALGPMNTTGLCRRCYQRELMRARRARAAE